MPIRPEHLPDEAPLIAPAEQQATPPARAPTHQQLLRLQQSAGNAAVSRLLGARRPTAARFVDDITMGAWGGAAGAAGAAAGAAGGMLGEAASGAAGGAAGAAGGILDAATAGAAGGAGAGGAIGGSLGEAVGGTAGAFVGGAIGGIPGAAGGAGIGGAAGHGVGEAAGGAAGSIIGAAAGAAGGAAGAAHDAAGAAGAAAGGAAGAAGIASHDAAGAAGAAAGGAAGAAHDAAGAAGAAAGGAAGAAGGILDAATAGAAGGAGAGGAVGGSLGEAVGGTAGAFVGGAIGGIPGAAGGAGIGGAAGHGVGEAAGGAAGSIIGAAAGAAGGAAGAAHDAAGAAGAAAGGAASGGGGGGGIDMDAPLNLGETIPALPDPAPPAIPALGQLGQALPALAPPVLPPPGNAPAAPDAGGFEQEAQGIEGATQGGGGGLLDSIVQAGLGLLQSITGSVAGNARGTAGAVGAHAGAQAGQAGAQAGEAAGSAHSEAQSAVSAATGEAHGHATGAQQEAKGTVSNAAQQAQQAPSQAAGMLDGLVSKVLAGAPAIATFTSPFVAIFNGIFGDLPGKLTAIIQKVQQRVDAILDRIIQTITGIARRIEAAIARIAAFVEGAISWVAGKVAALTAAANSALAALPGAVRSALSGLVSRLLGAVTSAAARIVARARALVQVASAGARAFLQRVAAGITAIVTGVKSVIDRAFAGVKAAIAAVAAAIAAVKAWLIAKVQALIAKAIRAVIVPLYNKAVDKLIQLIGPEVQAAITRAKLLFPNGVPTPPEIPQKAVEAAQQAGPSLVQQIKQGILHPEGDHFSFGFTYGAEAGDVVGGGANVGGTFEIVLDYRKNDIGFFVGPQAGVTGSVGDVGFTGTWTGGRSWGTVASFGEPDKDVLQSWGGWFSNANYGVTVGGAYGAGVSVSTGGSFYKGGSLKLDPPLFSYTPLGADSHPVGPTTPDTVTPGTPGKQENVDLGEIHFATQQSDPDAAPGGTGTMDQAAQAVRDQPTKAPGTSVTGVRVVGEASRRWLHPRPDKTREQENADLALQRASRVKAGMDARLHEVPPVSAHGAGDKRAAKEGKGENDGSTADQRAVIFADVNTPGTPGTVTPGTQPTAPNQHDVKVGIPMPFNPWNNERQAWGWDTTVGVSGLAGAGLKAQGYLGAGASYSFPIGKTHCQADTMEKIRIAAGVVKILSDIQSLSPLGLLRDIIALAGGGVAADAQPQVTQAVTSWALPTVPGA